MYSSLLTHFLLPSYFSKVLEKHHLFIQGAYLGTTKMSEKVVVKVNEGKVRGIKKISEFSNTEYYSFFEVPYGHNTGGTMRFKDPIPVKPWENVLDATSEKKKGCIQFSPRSKCLCGTEDCLFNNIHTPGIPSKDNPLKAVIVFIHPGCLINGTPETKFYGSPDYVVHLDVVYVCIAYRLHILGFLNLNVPECSGNQALKDVTLGLRWIKDNICAFGGDPDNVTLMGSSSGAAIVHHMMLSPSAKGLFHKAVMLGSYNFIPSCINKEENATLAYEMARDIGYNETDEADAKKLLSFYRKLSPEMIVGILPQKVYRAFGTPLLTSLFMPTVDTGINSVLPVYHRSLIETTSRVPLLYGICENEAFMGFCRGLKNSMLQNFFAAIRHNFFGWGYDITDSELEYIKERVEAFYWKGKRIETAPMSLKIDIQTDMIYSDVYKTLIDIIAKDLPLSVYVYKFTFYGNVTNLRKKLIGLIDEPLEGTLHADDLSYWTKDAHNGWNLQSQQLTPEENEMIRTFTRIIGTFAKNGNPNGEHLKLHWDPSTFESPCYMKIDTNMELIHGKLNGKRMEFWENLKIELKRQ